MTSVSGPTKVVKWPVDEWSMEPPPYVAVVGTCPSKVKATNAYVLSPTSTQRARNYVHENGDTYITGHGSYGTATFEEIGWTCQVESFIFFFFFTHLFFFWGGGSELIELSKFPTSHPSAYLVGIGEKVTFPTPNPQIFRPTDIPFSKFFLNTQKQLLKKFVD